MNINKRIPNNRIYKLLDSGLLDKIVRHYKIIKSKNYKYNDKNIINHNTDNYDNVFISSYDEVSNDFLNNRIGFDSLYESTNDISNIIDTSENTAYNEYKNSILTSDFSNDELTELKNTLIQYIDNNKDLYIRLGIDKNDNEHGKNYFLLKLFEITIADYFNELNEYNQNALLNNSLLPMFNDLIFYSNKKYDYVSNTNVNNILEDERYENLNKNIEEL